MRLAIAIIVILLPGLSLACSCNKPIASEMYDFDGHHYIFTAVVTKAELVKKNEEYHSVKVSFEADEIFKGDIAKLKNIKVFLENGACGYDVVLGKKYIFVSYEKGLTFSCTSKALDEWDSEVQDYLKEMRNYSNKKHNQTQQ